MASARYLTPVVAGALLVGGCSSEPDSVDPAAAPGPTAPAKAGSGPFFGRCGGVSTDEVVNITGFGAMVVTLDNTSSCVWGTDPDSRGAVASFNWYRGSPIGRERATVQLSKDIVVDTEIDGHHGFMASSETICEVGIAFGADFFEWSVRSARRGPDREQICASTQRLAELSIERAS